jgi:FdhE protein
VTSDPMTLRVTRAQLLAQRYPAAGDLLSFYAQLTECQRTLLRQSSGPDDDTEPLLEAIPVFLDWLARHAPVRLAESAAHLRQLTADDWRAWFDLAFKEPPPDPSPRESATLFVAESIVQPFAERQARVVRQRDAGAVGSATPARCPVCGCAPVAGVLREEGHGARRALVCARCATEWAYPRASCPSCGEQEFDKLPVYAADAFPHVRVEACDSCRRYLKTVDLTKDGLAIPQVDDVASLPLDLWARDHGYMRLRDNLLRT